MAKSKRSGKAHVSGYARYKNSNAESNNRVRKLTKLVQKHPNNLQLALAIKNIAHRRKVPKAPQWSKSAIRLAKIVKEFTGKFDRGIFNPNPDVFNAANKSRDENKFKQLKITPVKGSMFSIGERLGWKF